MEQIAGSETGYKAKVASFEYLNKFLEVAGESKLSEIQEMLQVCREPISQIFGVSGESGKALLESFDAFNNESDTRKKEQYAKLYKLLLVVNSFDLQLMKNAVKQGGSKEKYLDIAKVSEELEMLKSFCGAEPEHPLIKIDWDSGNSNTLSFLDFTFSNGFKAPPWRQIYGELSYIQVHCQDKDAFIVTASKKGYFMNKGYISDAAGNENLNYEATSEVFGTLVELLRSNSFHFSSKIDLQGYTYHRSSKETGLTAVAAEEETTEAPSVDTKADRAEEAHRRVEKDSTKRPKDGKKKFILALNSRSKSTSKAAHSAEPSLKWRALGLKEDSLLKDRKVKGSEKKRSESSKKDGKRRIQRTDSFDEDFEASDSDAYSEEEQPEKRQDGCIERILLFS